MTGSYSPTKLFVFGLLLFLAIPVQTYAQQNTYNDDETKEVIVKFANHTTQSSKREISNQIKAVPIKRFEDTDTELWRIPLIVEINGQTYKGLNTISDYVKSHPGIQYIEPNHSIAIFNAPNDPYFNKLWGLHNTGQLAGLSGADISILQAWGITIGGESTIIGVLDTGIDWTHEDLAENIWQNSGEDTDGDGVLVYVDGQWIFDPDDINGVDDDGNGYADDFIGWDFVNNDNNPYDDNEHGTHVSGIIGAQGNNGIGITGVAQETQLMPLKVFDLAGMGFVSSVREAMDYAIANGVDITNVSWGTPESSETLEEIFEDAEDNEILVVAAVGNNNRDNDIVPVYPASYDYENIIAVAATNRHNSLSLFSNYGETSVDIGAPGGDIYSTLPGNFYGWYSGTSMAAPHVTGALALALSACNGNSPSQIRNHLLNTATPLNTPNNKGIAVLNTYEFLQAVTQPNAEFSYIADGLEVEFTAQNEYEYFDYEWNFGNDEIQSSTENEIEYEYSESNNYIVCLTISDPCSSNTSCQNIFVNIDNVQPDCSPTWQQFTSGDNILALAEQGESIWAGGKGGLAKINRTDGTNIFFTNDNSGLPHNRINAISIDVNGIKWIGTKGGLVKFDGTNWTTFDTQNSGLPANDVQSIAITSDGQIWAATKTGVSLFNGESNWVTLDSDNAMLPDNEVNALIVDNQDVLFAATSAGVARLDTDGFTDLDIGTISADYNIVNDLVIDPASGNLWAATEGGVAHYDGTTWQPVNTGLTSNPILSIAINDGVQWAGTASGAYQLINNTEWQPQFDNLGTENGQRINTILATTNNELWFGTNRSLKKLESGQLSIFNELNSPLSGDIVYAFAEDNNQNTWIGTSNGLVQLFEEEWLQHSEFTNEEVHALHFDGNKLWAGTNLRLAEINVGVDISDITSHTPVNDIITSITSQDGQIWVSTQANGIAVFDAGSWTNYNAANSSLPDDNVYTMAADASTGGLWIATANGLANLHGNDWTIYNSPNSNNLVTGLDIDSNGTVWLTTSDNLARIDGTDTWLIENILADAPIGGIQGLSIDNYDDKWLATETGLCKYDGHSCTTYNVANSPLPNDNIQTIKQDAMGAHWIGTQGGVSILSALIASFTYDKQLPCNNTILPMHNSSTGAIEQTWYVNDVYVSSDENYTHDFEEAGTYEVKLISTNVDNCTAIFIEEITISDSAEDIALEPSVNICDDITLLESNLQNMQHYRWYKDGEMLGNTNQLTVLESGDYILEVQDWCDNISIAPVSVTLSERCIWPGDTNNDGRVNAIDVLPIGQAFGSTGAPRNDLGEWEGQANPDWDNENLAYADADGNGIVDSTDLQIVYANYGQTHGTAGLGLSSVIMPGSGFGASGYIADTPPDAYLYLVPDENSMFNGQDDILFNVELTEKDGTSIESYGIAYTLRHDGEIINIDFSETWLKGNGTSNELLTFEQNTPGQLDIAQSREDQNNIIGDGGVAEIIVLEDFPSGESASLQHTAIYGVENITLTDKDGNIIPVEGHTLVISHPGSELVTAPIALSVEGHAFTCYGEGSAEVTVHRGTAPFTYEWDNGETTAIATNLSPGLHHLTVTDAAGWIITSMAYIENHTGIFLDYEVSGESGDSENGSINLTTSGSSDFTYEWSSGQTSANIAGLQAGTYIVTITNNEGCQKVQTIVVPGTLCVKPKFILEGAFDASTGLMRNNLQAMGALPLVSPYETGESVSVNAFTAAEPHDAIIDWVVVELRDKISAKLVARQSALLQSDGDVIALDNTDGIKFDNLPQDNYYITVRHRNHFSLLSGDALLLERTPVSYDFTQLTQLPLAPFLELPELAPGIYGTYAGNAPDNILEKQEDINGDDKIKWFELNGEFNDPYNNADFNLNGEISGADKALWFNNNGQFNQLPD